MRKEALIDTYVDQVLTGPDGGTVPDTCFVFGTAISGGTADWEALHDRRRLMIDRLRELGFHAEPGYAIGALRGFVEPVVFATGMGYNHATAFIDEMGIEVYVQRVDESVYVLDGREECIASGPAALPQDTGVCVMPNTDPGTVCVMAGGPFGSRAISASMDWKCERERLISALGCGTCNQGEYYRMGGVSRQGQVFSRGGPIALVAHQVPTRFTALLEVGHG